jgi:glycosyltransferase involved in cell wall biosynthesis
MPHFDAYIALSDKMTAELKQKTDRAVYLLPNMVRVPKDLQRTAFRKPPVIGRLGRLSPEKGVDLFIDALALLQKKRIPFSAIIGGSGEIESDLKAQCTARGLDEAVSFIGWVDDQRAFFDNIDIFCLPSRTESFPITLLEAMAHGVPSVSTRCGGPSEIIEEGSTGRLADISAESLAEVLQAVLSSPEEAVALGIAAKKKVENEYEFSIVSDRLDAVLKVILHSY